MGHAAAPVTRRVDAMAEGMSFEILTPDRPEWGALFERLPSDQQDVFYAPAFARLCQHTLNKGDQVLCAAMTADAGVVLYPFVKRSLEKLRGVPSFAGLYDITGLYGRGGIVASKAGAAHLWAFHATMAQYCHEHGVVCGFDRFHPVIGNDACAAPETTVMQMGGFVVVDLRPEMDAIEQSFKYSVRKNLRKAERSGVTCFTESTCDHLDDFLDIYRHTMDRHSAADFYYVSEEYLHALARELPGQFLFCYAVAAEKVVSCELVLHHGKYGHSFLGGTRQDALPLCANPLLKREIIASLKQRGCEWFLLGGGTRPDDGVFTFKKAYAPEGVLPSRVGGTMWDRQTYERIRDELATAGCAMASHRFQFYDLT